MRGMASINLSPAQLDVLGVRAGDRNSIVLTLTEAGAPLDLTGKTLTSQVRLTTTATAKLDAVVTITDAPAGKVEVRWPGDTVRTLLGTKSSWKGVWDLQLEGTPDPLTLVAGKWSAVQDVTRVAA